MSMLRRHDDPSSNIAVAAAAQATISMRYLMRPRRIDTIDIITPTVMRVGRNSVVGRVASGQNRPKEGVASSTETPQTLLTGAPSTPTVTISSITSSQRSFYRLADQRAQTQFP